MIFLPSASTTKGRKKSAVEKKEIVVAHMANKRQIPVKEKKCTHEMQSTIITTIFHIFQDMFHISKKR